MTAIGLKRRSIPDRLRYLAAKLSDGQEYVTPVMVALEALADEMQAAPISPACDTGKHLDCPDCDCTCHYGTTQYQPPQREGDTT